MLSRRLGEKIHIGEDVTITVVDIDKGQVRLGFTCPRDVPIWREELLPAAELHRRAAKAGKVAPAAKFGSDDSPAPPAGAKP